MTDDNLHYDVQTTKAQPVVCDQDMGTHDRILNLAITQGAPLEQLEKFLQLKREHEAHEARKNFYQAVSDFKSETVVVHKDKENKQFNSKYTSLGNLLNTVNPVLSKYGLSVSFDIKQGEKTITVACILRHRLGHTESVELTAPPDTSGGNSKNPIQQIKSTITYLRSATFEAVTGLASTDANLDDDGNSAGGNAFITDSQAKEISKLLEETAADKAKFLEWAKSESIDSIPANKYSAAVALLNAKKRKTREPGQEG